MAESIGPVITLGLRLPVRVYDPVKKAASDKGLSMNALIVQVLEKAVKVKR